MLKGAARSRCADPPLGVERWEVQPLRGRNQLRATECRSEDTEKLSCSRWIALYEAVEQGDEARCHRGSRSGTLIIRKISDVGHEGAAEECSCDETLQ